MSRRYVPLSLVVAAALLVSACADSPFESARGPAASATSPPAPPGNTATDLLALEEAEKARIARRQEEEKSAHDSLKNEWDARKDDPTTYATTLFCDPLQYVATVKIVGPEGGDVNFGPHSLRIPPGALLAPTVITAEAPTSLQVRAVFSPHGTVFQAGSHPTLELSYKHCLGPLNRPARIAYSDALGNIVAWPPSEDFPDLGLVRGVIGHFSLYIVAY
jgi:hypothetical protein